MYKQGDILLVPIPFSDLTSNKKRPVLVLSNDDYNIRTADIVVAAITSNLAAKDYIVMLTGSELDEGTLKVDSCIRVDKIYTLSQSIVDSNSKQFLLQIYLIRCHPTSPQPRAVSRSNCFFGMLQQTSTASDSTTKGIHRRINFMNMSDQRIR